jgi:putative transposase
MKGKRYTTEEKIRILRETDKGVAIAEVCREHNLSQVTFHRWKRQFGQMEVKEARRLKDLERENGELKKMLAEALLKEPGIGGGMRKKIVSPGASAADGQGGRGGRGVVLWASGVPDLASVTSDASVSCKSALAA